MIELKINPEFHNLIPQISLEEYQLLEENLINEGCREALIVWPQFPTGEFANECNNHKWKWEWYRNPDYHEGEEQGFNAWHCINCDSWEFDYENILIDGHTRYEICRKHQIDFDILEKEFSDEEEVKIWIIRNQLARRNLPPAERARLVLSLKPLIMEKAKEHQKRKPESVSQISAEQKIDTREELAKTAGVSHDTISKVETIEKKASPEVKEAVRKGEISVNKAFKATRPKKENKIPPLRHDSDNLQRLKIAWKAGSESDRKKFLIWIKKEAKK